MLFRSLLPSGTTPYSAAAPTIPEKNVKQFKTIFNLIDIIRQASGYSLSCQSLPYIVASIVHGYIKANSQEKKPSTTALKQIRHLGRSEKQLWIKQLI